MRIAESQGSAPSVQFVVRRISQDQGNQSRERDGVQLAIGFVCQLLQGSLAPCWLIRPWLS